MTKKVDSTGKAWASLICSVVGILLFLMPYFGLPLGILGVVFSRNNNLGLAKAGKIVGIVGIVINSIMLFFVAMFLLIGLAFA